MTDSAAPHDPHPPLRTALIGCGRIAQDYITVLADSTRIQLTDVVEPDAAARAAAVGRTGARGHADPADLFAASALDAVVIASPPSTHADLATQALACGAHVFCEKPLATSTVDAERMFAASAAAGRHIMMATKFRFVDDVAAARRLIADGAIGTPTFYSNVFCAHVDMAGRWNTDPARSGGGVLIDNGTHSIDLARFLIGPIARVSATFGPRIQPVEVEDSAVLLFEGATRAVGRVELSWSVDQPTEHYVEVHGEKGTVQIGWQGSRVRTSGGWSPFGSGYAKHRAFAAQLEHFADVVQGAAEPIVTLRDALASVRIVDAAYRAARNGTWEDIDPMEEVG